ncbi:hypothetical protein P170DRAFT_360968 [Aspergillus steynii IBT 23096]|uniref:Methyltransferase domain-containing protein n=1 Tax=Aspergillus steynii IBT 23096 TaxID=1392250 RepID=A0A2I2G6L2_9EURO|nr:uncharacterized protein P170DRAFT_360968 [Aspergillus steynii IBT 23096]PLB48514.1 hypothetical protein P170DRAFT_360968 [Aspergillus steynii IBT 23096]
MLSPPSKPEPDDFTNSTTQGSKDVIWYQDALEKVPDIAQQILVNYAGIPEPEVLDHIYRVREKAWNILPYPCIGNFKFLSFPNPLSPVYPEALARIRTGHRFLDLGCCVGQGIRKLVYDGAPAENLIGVDCEGRFVDLGYELFNDRGSLRTEFYVQDVFDENFLSHLRGQVDIIYLGLFLHLFSFDRQKVIMAQVMKLLRKRKGSLVYGRHVGGSEGGVLRNEAFGWDLYYHSPETIRELFEVGGDGEWDVQVQLYACELRGWEKDVQGDGGGQDEQMAFVARRL